MIFFLIIEFIKGEARNIQEDTSIYFKLTYNLHEQFIPKIRASFIF